MGDSSNPEQPSPDVSLTPTQKLANEAEASDYRGKYPPFCLRLQVLAGFFVLAQVGWAVVVSSIFVV